MLAKIDNKIDKEVANIIAIYERYKNDTIKYAAGKEVFYLDFLLLYKKEFDRLIITTTYSLY